MSIDTKKYLFGFENTAVVQILLVLMERIMFWTGKALQLFKLYTNLAHTIYTNIFAFHKYFNKILIL